MQNQVKLHDKVFEISLREEVIKEKIQNIAQKINKDYEGKCPIVMGVLNGSFMFCADLVREFTMPCEVCFVKLSSYDGTESTGEVKQMIGVKGSVEGRDIILVEDIVETGATIKTMIEELEGRGAASVRVCSLFFKPEKLVYDIKVDYPAIDLPDGFIVGYGLDYNELGRELRHVYTLVK